MWLKVGFYVKKIQNYVYSFYKFFPNPSGILENACNLDSDRLGPEIWTPQCVSHVTLEKSLDLNYKAFISKIRIIWLGNVWKLRDNAWKAHGTRPGL